MARCKYNCCNEQAVKNGRCAVHHQSYLKRRAATAAAKKCACGNCIGHMQERCSRCQDVYNRRRQEDRRNAFIDDLMRRSGHG